jgi:hypothetical protein
MDPAYSIHRYAYLTSLQSSRKLFSELELCLKVTSILNYELGCIDKHLAERTY